MKLLFFADIVGRSGREVVRRAIAELRLRHSPDLVIANCDNVSGGRGIQLAQAKELLSGGIDLMTSGNHIWDRREIYSYLDKGDCQIIRPLNYPLGNPGKGWLVKELANGKKIAIVHLIARVMMPENVDCPFRAIEGLLENELRENNCVFVDFHGEATSEKVAMGQFLDGRVSCVVGTHTHVQTADECILSGGTAYISDVGMCGPIDSVIGVDKKIAIERFLKSHSASLEVAKGPSQVNAVVVDIDDESGKARSIQRIFTRE